MARITVSSDMPETVERIFEIFTDVEHAAQHVSAIKKTEMLTTGTFSRGTCWRWRISRPQWRRFFANTGRWRAGARA